MAAEIRARERYTYDEWLAEARRRFGENPAHWAFTCPSCGHVATVADWKAAGASAGEIAFSCVGRRLPNPKRMGEKPGPCDYAGGGLFRLNPVTVVHDDKEHELFAFADSMPPQQAESEGQ